MTRLMRTGRLLRELPRQRLGSQHARLHRTRSHPRQRVLASHGWLRLRRPAGLIACALGAGALAGASWLAAAPASAAEQGPSCVADQCAVTFTTGVGQSFTVPAGVSSLSVRLYGGMGGTNYNEDVTGGDGAEVTATLSPVTAGQVLGVDVGGAGAGGVGVVDAAGGVNGGGSSHYGGGGGGATDVTSAGTPLLVAGGGGGAGANAIGSGCSGLPVSPTAGAGGNAGNPGGTGGDATDGTLVLGGGGGGQPGTSTSAGAGGSAGQPAGSSPCGVGTFDGTGGAGGQGSTGGSGTDVTLAGGGGGGYTGGGSGASGATETGFTSAGDLVNLYGAPGGGGGGSSYTGGAGVSDAAASDTGNSGQLDNGRNGQAVLSYTDPVATGAPAYTVLAGQSLAVPAGTGLLSSAAGTSAPAGDALTASGPADGTTAAGGTVSVAADGSFSYTPPAGFTGSDSFSYTVTDASGDYAAGTATISVQLVPQTITFSTTAPQDATYGGSYTPSATATSGLPVSFSVDASSSAGACSLDPSSGVVSFTGTGTCTVDANQAGNSTYAAAPQVQQSFTIGAASPQVMLSVTPSSGATVASDVQLSATVLGLAGDATPTGSLTFTVDGSPASCGSAGAVALTNGQASCDLGMLPVGSHDFAASYSGDSNYGTAADAVTGYQVQLLSQTVTFTTSAPSPADFGGSYTPTVTASSGLAVTLNIDSSSSPGACTVSADGSTVEFTGTGTCVVDASQAGNSQYMAASAQQSFTIAPASTMTSVSVTASTLTATVTAEPPGGGTPSGMVTFMVGGTTVGTADLNAAGVATVSYTSHGAETVAASYAGTADYLPSAVSTATKDPVIKATVTSKYPKSKYGWYRAPVTVTFTCTAGSAPLSAPCPGPVTLARNGANQRVSKTINGTDGGIATVTVVVNIDQSAPKVTVTGIKNKAIYDAPGPAKIGCQATENISGLAAACKLTVRRGATAITWTAEATSKAGITTKVTGKATVLDYFVARVPLRHGRFLVTVNHTYTIEAYLPGMKKAPRYVDPAPAGVRPHPVGPALIRIGHGLWAIRTAISARMDREYENWNIGILVGHTLHLVPITLKR